MRLMRSPRGWIWAGGVAGLAALLAYVGAYLTDEPLRRYVEREVNGRLTGYSVRFGDLSIHPLAVSFTLSDATIYQDAAPDPPIAHVGRLRTSVDWRALLHGRVVADIAFEQPRIHIDLKKIRTEAASEIALKDRGWQRALEAVALDMKINRLRVVGGDVTYVDDGPFKPLRVSQIDATVENIRNIRSKGRTYPSELHVRGTVFDTGELWLDGHADFLSEPHPGVQARFKLRGVELDYFKPITNRVNLSVRRGTLTVAGNAEYAPTIKQVALERVLVDGAQVDYVHDPQTEADRTRASTARAAKEVANDPGVRLRVDRVDITRANIGFVNRAVTPPYRLVLAPAELSLDNLSNQRAEGTAALVVRGKLNGSGDARVWARFRPETKSGDLDVKIQVENAAIESLRELVQAYGNVRVEGGSMSVYAELHMKGDAIEGYVKPLFKDLQPTGSLSTLAAKLLENRPRGEIATVVKLSGPASQPQVSTWQILGGLLRNAFFKAILPGFERAGRAPEGDLGKG